MGLGGGRRRHAARPALRQHWRGRRHVGLFFWRRRVPCVAVAHPLIRHWFWSMAAQPTWRTSTKTRSTTSSRCVVAHVACCAGVSAPPLEVLTRQRKTKLGICECPVVVCPSAVHAMRRVVLTDMHSGGYRGRSRCASRRSKSIRMSARFSSSPTRSNFTPSCIHLPK